MYPNYLSQLVSSGLPSIQDNTFCTETLVGSRSNLSKIMRFTLDLTWEGGGVVKISVFFNNYSFSGQIIIFHRFFPYHTPRPQFLVTLL